MADKRFLAASWRNNSLVCGVSLGAILIALVMVNSNWGNWNYATVWIVTTVLVTIAMMVVGAGVNGRLQGVLIDSRNRVSLSKFQMALWTILVVSTLATAAAFNESHGGAVSAQAAWTAAQETGKMSLPWGPLDIQIPPDLLAAMGIAATSLVAAPSLLSLKSADTAAPGALSDTTSALGLQSGQTGANGKVFYFTSPQSAGWADMFRGDEAGSAASADLGKVQQFAITVLLVAAYANSVRGMFVLKSAALLAHGAKAASATIVALPPLSGGFVLLMGISHAGYLAYKAAPHTSSGAVSTNQSSHDGAAG